MSDEAAWRRYFYPGTQVLRNKFDFHDGTDLAIVEYAITRRVYESFISGDLPVEGTTSSEKLRFIHGELLGEVYDWAGEFRDVNMNKGGHSFGDHNSMDMYMRQLDGQLGRTNWESLNFDGTIDRLAEVHTDLNFVHPFREGNGRTTRVFMTDLAAEHGVDLDFNAVPKDLWNQASADTYLDPGGINLTAEPLKIVYQQISSPAEPASNAHDVSTSATDVAFDQELNAAMNYGNEAYNGDSLSAALSEQGEHSGLDAYDDSPVVDVDKGNDYGFDR